MVDELMAFLKNIAPQLGVDLSAEGLTNSTKSVTGESLLDRKLVQFAPKIESGGRIQPPQGIPNSPISPPKKSMTP